MSCLGHRTVPWGISTSTRDLRSVHSVHHLRPRPRQPLSAAASALQTRRHFKTSSPRPRKAGILQQVPCLESWDADLFYEKAYSAAFPARLPRSASTLPPACWKWFIHDGDLDFKLIEAEQGHSDTSNNNEKQQPLSQQPQVARVRVRVPRSSELRPSFWQEYQSTIVPLELTTTTTKATAASASAAAGAASSTPDIISKVYSHEEVETFQRIEAPLGVLLKYLSSKQSSASAPSSPSASNLKMQTIYLAQCEISSLPPALQRDIPTPDLLFAAQPSQQQNPTSSSTALNLIKGDIYSSSLWLGRPPTYTPLHRDPNPNLFIQLAGRKVMRLLPPEVGDAVFEDVQRQLLNLSSSFSSFSSTIRGEEMMAGPEMVLLHDAVWGATTEAQAVASDDATDTANDSTGDVSIASNANATNASFGGNRYANVLNKYGFQVELGIGEALFIPKGWWHSVKGVGDGVTASVNWWFR
ncbi:hypothetical protein HRR86_009068 [Exophiala dermatitidis]|nr:hypothetical protein HRR73_005084 [Exophiala dermatitidis]KAJ4591673.1 hypothetical protein HRR84_007405 [Exophiala dermatitidis]KAJ4611780.1 hypothetical protein HRR86_009068 [Exophiala dermatitidis]